MISKIGLLLFDPEKNKKFKILSNISFLLGILFLLSFPYWQERFYITEKQMKVSENHSNDFKEDTFIEKYKYLTKQNLNKQDVLNSITEELGTSNPSEEKIFLNYLLKIFKPIKLKHKIFEVVNLEKVKQLDIASNLNLEFLPTSHVLSYKIISPRGDRMRYLMFNFILDMNVDSFENIYITTLYTFLSHFQNQENITWLAKDIYVNIISKEDFYNSPASINDLLVNNDYYNTGKMDFVLNLDLGRLDHLDKLIVRYNGISSEVVDMDFLKLVYDNLTTSSLKESQISLNDNRAVQEDSKRERTIDFVVKSFVNYFDSFKFIKPYSKISHVNFNYRNEMKYFIHNLFSVFLIDYKVDLGTLLAGQGINSITLFNKLKIENSNSKPKLSDYIDFMKVLERIVKGLSIAEIDIFRGHYHYIFVSNTGIVGKIPFMFILVLCVFRLVFQLISKLHKKELFKESNNPGLIVVFYLLFYVFSIYVICETCYSFNSIKSLIEALIIYYPSLQAFSQYFTQLNLFYISFSLCGLIYFFVILNFTKFQIELNSIINSFIVGVMGFNFFFINYGLGLLWVAFIYLNDFIYFFVDPMDDNKLWKNKSIKIKLLLKSLISMGFIYYIAFSDFLNWSNLLYNYELKPNSVLLILAASLINLVIMFTNEFVLMLKIDKNN